MGVCTSKDNKGAASADGNMLNKDLRPRILLLGAGEVGKSTIVKQLKIAFGDGFHATRRETRQAVYKNVLHGMQAVVKEMPTHKLEVSSKTKPRMERLMALKDYEETLTPTIAPTLQTVWNDPAVQRCHVLMTQQPVGVQPNDHLRFFMGRLQALCHPKYEPSDQDIVWTKTRTTGIVDEDISIDGFSFLLYDMGGQRHERTKWLHCMEGSSAVVFVASLSDYDRFLAEDASTNRLIESLKLFEGVLNMFSGPVYLILSKTDVLKDKLNDASSGNFAANHPDYRGNSNDYEQVLSYIKQAFLRCNSNEARQINISTISGVVGREVSTCFQHVKTVLAPSIQSKN